MIMALAKVMIVAAWTDGSVTNEEMNSLKDLLFHLPGMTARDWSELEIYLETPIEPGERTRLVARLQEALASREDRELALRALEDLIQADGAVSDQERAVFQEIKTALENVNTNIFGQFNRLISGPVQRRTDAITEAPNRELDLEDFIRNKIYYKLSQHLKKADLKLDLPEPTVRMLSLAGGLMARIAFVDRAVTEKEFEGIAAAMEKNFDLEREPAAFVAQVAVSTVSKDLDYYRLSREFFESTKEAERVRFLDALFTVAAADGLVSHQEMEEIRTIATVLKLTHKQFIDAKLRVPREQRAY
jgi:uncharacterized tellurite resistance protein B-like protein